MRMGSGVRACCWSASLSLALCAFEEVRSMRLLLSSVILFVSSISRRAVAISFLDCSNATEILCLDTTARTIQQIKKLSYLNRHKTAYAGWPSIQAWHVCHAQCSACFLVRYPYGV